ncbi:succinyl-CoA synthetase subunit beta [Marinobacter sp. NP-4(2019)]|uniref:succinyl-CoA synthetase subunit beta n=1 Tax=Marinobacter sp. NP-4(2019) TaxID=2488665 RepID=UPI000FC3D791|nr:succinyl-CoA synthetase subunit beta [Marinobacter sp. NP-4(2019)]AZT84750.1 succinyl-CoA synthetase subunit beta [Marinobacter sp. NP-4(2019)]
MGFDTVYRIAHKGPQIRILAFAGVLISAPLFFIGGPDWTSGPLHKSVWNLGHILYFGLLTYAIQPWRWLSGRRLWLTTTALVLALGLVIEFLQSGLGRQDDWHDVWRNLVGTWLALACRPILTSDTHRNTRQRLLAALAVVLVVFELGLTGSVAVRQFQINQQLPALYDFSRNDPATFWRGKLEPSDAHSDINGQSLKISLSTRLYSGVTLDNLPVDWRDYDQLTVTLFNPDDADLTLTLRINDVEHERGSNVYSDRFNTQLPLKPGLNTFTLGLEDIENAPRNRAMNMDNIRRLGIFTTRLPAPRTIYLLDLRLK